MTTRQAVLLVLWVSAAIALASIVPWADYHTVRIAGDDDLVATRLGDGWLVATVASVSALAALRMLREPSELAWGLLVAASGLTFVLVASAASTSYAQCSDSTILPGLGFLGTFLPPCYREGGTFWLAGADPSLYVWGLALAAVIGTLVAMFLPIVETIERTNSWKGTDEW